MIDVQVKTAQLRVRKAEHELADARHARNQIELDVLAAAVPEDWADKNRPAEKPLALSRGKWACEASPTGRCAYDMNAYMSFDGCIFCHEPEERR